MYEKKNSIYTLVVGVTVCVEGIMRLRLHLDFIWHIELAWLDIHMMVGKVIAN